VNDFKVIPFDEKYLDEFEYDGLEQELLGDMNIKKMIKEYAKAGNCWIGLNSDKPIIFAGIYLINSGVAQSWLLMNLKCKKHTMRIIREIRKHIRDVMKSNNLHRLQTLAMNNKRVEKFLRIIGFQKEATLRKFTSDKKDMNLYTIIRRN